MRTIYQATYTWIVDGTCGTQLFVKNNYLTLLEEIAHELFNDQFLVEDDLTEPSIKNSLDFIDELDDDEKEEWYVDRIREYIKAIICRKDINAHATLSFNEITIHEDSEPSVTWLTEY